MIAEFLFSVFPEIKINMLIKIDILYTVMLSAGPCGWEKTARIDLKLLLGELTQPSIIQYQ